MQLASSVPDIDQYLAAVPQSPSDFEFSFAFGDADGGPLGSGWGDSLGTSFEALGMQPEMVFQFVPVVLQYLQQRRELPAMTLLENALY